MRAAGRWTLVARGIAMLAGSLPFVVANAQDAASRPAAASDHLNVDFYGTVQHSDNVYLTPDNEQGQAILRPRIDLSYLRAGAAVDSNLSGTFEGRQYLGGAFSPDLIGNFAGQVNWHLMPGRLDWVFEDYVSTSGKSPISNGTPDDSQLANVLVTGPTLRGRFSPRLSSQLDLRYARSDAQSTGDFDGNRLAAAGRLMYVLTPTSKAGLNLAVQEARYDTAPPSTEYGRRDAFLNAERRGSNNALSIEAGYTWLDFLGRGGEFAGTLLRANASFQLSARASVAVQLARQYTDAADSMATTPTRVGVVVNNSGLSRIAITPDIYREQRAGLSFRYSGDTWSARFEPFVREVRYLHPNDLAIDMDSRGLDVYADYRFTPVWMLSTYLHIENGKYPSLGADDDNRLFSAFLLYQFARRWAWRFEYSHQQRDSDIPGFTYRENVIGTSLIYRRYERPQQ